MFAELMNLGMTVMTSGNAVIRTRCLDLLILQLAIGQALLLKPGLQKPAAAAAAVIVGFIGLHINEVFLAHNCLDHITQIFSNGIAETFSNNLARILNRKLDFQILVPVGIDFQFPLTDPFGIIFINVLDFKIVFDIEFFQSGPD